MYLSIKDQKLLETIKDYLKDNNNELYEQLYDLIIKQEKNRKALNNATYVRITKNRKINKLYGRSRKEKGL